MDVLSGFLAYLVTQGAKSNASWSKLLTFGFALLVSVGVTAFTQAGIDPNTVVNDTWKTFAGSSAFWAVFKMLGIGDAFKFELLPKTANIGSTVLNTIKNGSLTNNSSNPTSTGGIAGT